MMRLMWIAAAFVIPSLFQFAAAQAVAPSPLLAIDQHRATVVERIVGAWGDKLAAAGAGVEREQLREMLLALRADQLLAASLAGSLTGLRDVLVHALVVPATPPGVLTKALGDSGTDVVYTPVTPCRLVETRGTFAAVYQGGGAFAPSEVRNYAVQGGNGVCLAQLPAGLPPAAVQVQVFGLPTSAASGDIEVLPQGSAFGSTATMVYIGSLAFNTVSTTAKINLATNQIGVQVRGGGAHVAVDVVGYFAAPSGNGGQYFKQGGNAFGATAVLGTTTSVPLNIVVNGQPVMRYELGVTSPNVIGGHPNNGAAAGEGQTIAGGGFAGNNCYSPISGTNDGSCGNQTAGVGATVSGGIGNSATSYATVAGGSSGRATGPWSTVGGGQGNLASGEAATIPGGNFNVATGLYSFAAGYGAKADGNGCFIFANWSGGEQVGCGATRIARFALNHGISFDYLTPTANGAGTRYVYVGDLRAGNTITAWNGASLSDGGVWQNMSDRNGKDNFADVDPQDVLAKLVALPITRWNHRADPGVARMGPMAQDFHAAFGLGPNDTTISSVDTAGVAYAAIQGLHQIVREKEDRIAALERVVDELKRAIAALAAQR